MSAEDSQSTISSDPTLESMSLLGKGFTMAKNKLCMLGFKLSNVISIHQIYLDEGRCLIRLTVMANFA